MISYTAQPGEEKSLFKVIVTLNPNPSNYKGMDDARIDIWRTQRNGEPTNVLWRMSEHHSQITACMADLNKQINDFVKIHQPPEDGSFVEINGKKFKLTEVK